MLKRLHDKLFLIGVAHVLPKSASEAVEVIEREKPEVVAVELCPARYMVLTMGRREGALDAARAGPRLLSLSGLINLVQRKFSNQTGAPVGEEMLIAIDQAKEVGARIELIDQDIRVTMQRLTERMPLREKIRMFGELLIGLLPFFKGVDLERLTDDDIVERMLAQLKQASPTTYDVLIRERDEYMASKLAMLMTEGAKVVCVVGAGHVPGICRRLNEMSAGSWKVDLVYGVSG